MNDLTIRISRDLAARLSQWHGGQATLVYAVSSSEGAREAAHVRGAIDELERCTPADSADHRHLRACIAELRIAIGEPAGDRDSFASFLEAYTVASLWASTVEIDGESVPADSLGFPLSRQCARKFKADCLKFWRENPDVRGNPLQGGHDFFLTRNGHGAGFWDRDPGVWPNDGADLTAAAQACGETNLHAYRKAICCDAGIVSRISWGDLPAVDKRESPSPRGKRRADGYGQRIPTSREVKINGRWRRVCLCQWSNAGTCYIDTPAGWIVVTD